MRAQKIIAPTILGMALAGLCGQAAAADAGKGAQYAGASKGGKYIERGRYLVSIAGCNDCHTAGYPQSGGRIPERDWLKGDAVGWRGPWGTTYAANLRLAMSKMSEQEWIEKAKTTQFRPPMPWFALRDMTKEDLRSIYRFVRYLGPAGEAMPGYMPPGKTPPGPFIQFPDGPK